MYRGMSPSGSDRSLCLGAKLSHMDELDAKAAHRAKALAEGKLFLIPADASDDELEIWAERINQSRKGHADDFNIANARSRDALTDPKLES